MADRGMERTWPIDIFERAGRRQRAASNNIGSPGKIRGLAREVPPEHRRTTSRPGPSIGSNGPAN